MEHAEELPAPPGLSGLSADTLADVAVLLWQAELDIAALEPEVLAALSSPENSATQTGDRMQRFLRFLVEDPIEHAPDRADLYTSIIPHCAELTPLQAYVLRNALGKEANVGYAPIPRDVEFTFPRDHEVKLDAQVGWHFLVGSCWDAEGTEYGVEIMFFGTAMYPPGVASDFGLSPLENQVVEMQFAVSVRGERHHQAAPVVAAGTSGLVRTGSAPFAFRLGRNAMVSRDPDDLFPLQVVARGVDRGDSPPLPLGLDLVLASGDPVLLQGADGLMPSVGGIGTYYYSIPNIQVDPQASSLLIGDRHVEIVRGQFWFDHQWGFLSGLPTDPVLRAATCLGREEPSGWDWFMVHFRGDRQVTMFAPHRLEFASFYGRTEAEPPGPMTRRVGGKYVDADSSTRVVWGTMVVDDWVKADHSPDPDRYPATGVWHPAHFRFTFEGLPDDIAEFAMQPIVPGSQSAFFANGAQISEGAVVVTDPSGTDVGRGFAESVSYADTTANMVRLAGLPVTDEMIAAIRPPVPSAALVAANEQFVAGHQDELAAVMADARGMEFFIETPR